MKLYLLIYLDDTYPVEDILVFSSQEKVLEYFEKLYPEAKNLRIKEHRDYNFSVYNYNSVLNPRWSETRIVYLDKHDLGE